jgi:carboxyl-terminal processing protease
MGRKLKVAGLLTLGAVAGALTTIQLQAYARNSLAPLPLEELQQLAAVFGMVKSDYVEPVDEKKLISDAISGMVAGLDPHSQYFDRRPSRKARPDASSAWASRSAWKTAWSRWSPRSKVRPPSVPASRAAT